jgi:hypothetical protein
MEGLRTLVENASQFTAEAFVQSVDDRMPELHRGTKAVLARLSILIQIMNEIESESRAQEAPEGE